LAGGGTTDGATVADGSGDAGFGTTTPGSVSDFANRNSAREFSNPLTLFKRTSTSFVSASMASCIFFVAIDGPDPLVRDSAITAMMKEETVKSP
jgi:hypothetical protein